MVKKYALSILFLVAIVGIKTSVVHALDIDTDTDFLYAPEVKTISMDFKDANLNDVLKIFSQQSGMNFIAATSVADKQINLYLDKVPVEAALERILSANGLTYEVTAGSNVFVVKELERPEIETITKVYNLKHASVSNSKLYKTLTIGESAEGDAAAAPAAGGEEDGAPTTLLDAVQSLIGGDEAVGSVVEDQRTNSLVVTTTPSRFAQIDQMIARLDVRIPQILIEAELLDISKENADLLGAKFGDTPYEFSGSARLGGYFPFNTDKVEDVYGVEPTYGRAFTDFSGLTFALQFLRTQTDTKSLARPRILTLNNETAEIRISANEATGIESIEENQETNTREITVRRDDTGVFLLVTPQANLDTKEITLAVEPRVIQAKPGRSINLGGTLGLVSFVAVEERGAKSMLRVMDGDTVIIGGLLRNEVENVGTKVPLLSKVPILGAGFRHKDKNETQRELIIFLTPHILKETVTANLEGRKDIPIVREQGIPNQALKEINKDLSLIENQRY